MIPASRVRRRAVALALGHPSRADDEVRLVRDDRLDQAVHLGRVVLAVGIEGHDDIDAEPLGDEVAGLEGGALAAVDRVADDVGALRPGDVGRPVAGAIVDDQDVGGQAGHLRRHLGQDAGQAVGLVERRDADEDPAPGLAAGGLELRRRQRPDEAAHPLVRAIGPTQCVEHQQIGDRHRDDEHGDEASERFALEAQDVLDRPDDVREQRDAEQAEADEEEPGRAGPDCRRRVVGADRSRRARGRPRGPDRRCAGG